MHPGTTHRLAGARASGVDLAGAAVLAAGVAWTFLSAARHPGSRPAPTALALLGAAGAVAAGRWARAALRRRPDRFPLLVGVLLGTFAGLLVRFEPAVAGGPPLGYANANGALFGLVALAAAAAHWGAPRRPADRTSVALVAVALVATAASGSVGASGATAAGLGLAWVAARGGHRRAAVPVAVVAVVLALGVASALAEGAGPQQLRPDSFGIRVGLWREAVALAESHPATGVGPGQFAASATLAADPDLRRTHSLPLQTLAEQGGPGLVVLLGLLAWWTAALWAARREPTVAIGAGVLLCVGLQALWDWVLADPAVLLTAAALVGWTTWQRPPQGAGGSAGSA